MGNHKSSPHRKLLAGFTLPAILVVVAALLILAVGILIVASIERNTARSFVDRERADLAAKAGLEDIRGILNLEAANDDFIILQSTLPNPNNEGHQRSPQLFLARGQADTSGCIYHYTPLFSTIANSKVTDTKTLELPEVKPLVGSKADGYTEFETLPYLDKACASWLPVLDDKNRMTARYAYWVEDLQSRVDAGTAGNTKGNAGTHKRYGWKVGDVSSDAKFPAPGLNAEPSMIGSDGRDQAPPLDQVALYALDPDAGPKDNSSLDKTIIDGRKALVSPDSVLAVAGVAPPLTRDVAGHLVDATARAVEENLTALIRPYDEQALVPFAFGVDPSVAGKPKLNLNSLLAMPSETAVDRMAAWIKKGLPKFEVRKGGFPDDYLKTLAANAIDYADTDCEATVSKNITQGANAYRGLDVYPLMSEVILHTKYQGPSSPPVNGRKRLNWQIILYAELWNHTNLPVEGSARVSYENRMRPPAIGAGVSGDYFDDPALVGDPHQVVSTPPLERIGNRYWSGPIAVDLQPNQYQFYKAAVIDYSMDVGPASQTLQNTFEIYEDLGASGISLMWNDREVDRSDKLFRGNSNSKNSEFEYITNFKKQSGKAHVPGHSYGKYNTVKDYKNNMGDSRQALYLRDEAYPLSDNYYPGNVSPNCRNVRNFTIYKNAKDFRSVYGRVLPSEWPDGGHDTGVSGLRSSPQDSPIPVDNYDPTGFAPIKNFLEGEAPTVMSNRGRFYSATELGRIYDPIMFTPTYDDANDTKAILTGTMPGNRVSWPSVEVASTPDIDYGGGNTLRIGRPEHPQFDQPAKHAPAGMPGKHAARLLDLFHAGKSRSEDKSDREGPLVRIEGHININTASSDAIRAMVSGLLVADPRLLKRISEVHSPSTSAPPVSSLEVSVPTKTKEGDVLADAIIRGRPYSSPSEIASTLNDDGKVAFGNRDLLPEGNKTQWSDAAAEEAFGRVYEASTVRSRNFRVWVVGQSVSPTSPTNTSPEVLAEVRRAYTIFADPGVRKPEGTIDITKFRITTLNENDF
ncbi:MAG: hypothetical protein ABI162_01020 [Luteolibacter sp.]